MNIKNQKISKNKKTPIIIGIILALVIAIFTIGAIESSLLGKSAIKIVSAQSVFQPDENPQFIFTYTKPANLFSVVYSGIKGLFSGKNKFIVVVQAYDAEDNKIEGVNFQVKQDASGEFVADLENSQLKSGVRPGKYKLKFQVNDGNTVYTQEKDFIWGVLAINSNKSIYLPGENAYLQMAALKDDGHTVCNSKLELQIQNPNAKIQKFSTDERTIQLSGQCLGDNVTDAPDYFAYYKVSEPGKYKMKLTNLENNYSITEYFEVKESLEFDIERTGPTRIWPQAAYKVGIKVKPSQNFEGQIVESVPQGFIIKHENQNAKIEDTEGGKRIIWQGKMLAGEAYELEYNFDAPDISPYLYFLGPLKISDNSGNTFSETRIWKVASDATGWSTTNGQIQVNHGTVKVNHGTVRVNKTIGGGGGEGGSGSYYQVVPNYLDDGYEYGSTWYATQITAGNAGVNVNAGVRFTGITIPAGATITSAVIKLYHINGSGLGTVRLRIRARDSANADRFDGALPSGVSLTSQYADWSYSDAVIPDWHQTPDIKAVVQQLVTNYGGLSNAAINFALMENGSDSDNYSSFEDVADAGGHPAELIMTWTYSSPAWVCGNALIDSRDAKSYATVQIGVQCWMAQNLNVGTRINISVTQDGWSGTTCTSIDKHCYNNTDALCDSTNNPTYPDGGLYQWNQAMCGSTTEGVQGICPTGWHIPTDAEWYTLERYLWRTDNCSSTRVDSFECSPAATDLKPGGSSGFGSNLTGYCHSGTTCEYRTFANILWASTQISTNAWYRLLDNDDPTVLRFSVPKSFSATVRCLKD